MAATRITDTEPREDTGSHRRPVPPAAAPAPPPPPGRLSRLLADRALLLVWGFMAAFAALFSWMSVQGYRGFSTGRFDLGNMVQAVWSTTQGRPLDTTDISGVQFSRLGAHVDPVLVLFAPLWMLWSSPEMLLVAQAVIVAAGALPAFWLGRRWLGDDRLALAGAAAYLLYPALGNATLFDFHPVTLAAPLLLFCIWAFEESRWVTLAVCATLAALCQEQVGLLLVALAVWGWFRHPEHRRAAVALAVGGAAWVVIAVGVILPVFGLEATNAHIDRYSRLGNGPGDIALTFVTRPWDVAEILFTPGRILYLVGLLIPLLLLPARRPAARRGGAAPAAHQPLRQHRPGAERRVPLRRPDHSGLRGRGPAGARQPARARPRRPRSGASWTAPGPWPALLVARGDPHRGLAGAAAPVGLGARGMGEPGPRRPHGGRPRARPPEGGGHDPARTPRSRPPTTPDRTCPRGSGSTCSRRSRTPTGSSSPTAPARASWPATGRPCAPSASARACG